MHDGESLVHLKSLDCGHFRKEWLLHAGRFFLRADFKVK